MMSFCRLIVVSSGCRRLIIPQMSSLKLMNSVLDNNSFTFSRCNQIRRLAMKDTNFNDSTNTPGAAPKKERAKTLEVPKITLLDLNNKISVCTMQEAEKIASSKNLRLVQVIDPKMKTQRRTFKLMSEADYLQEELSEKRRVKVEKKKDAFIKGDKIMTISTRSSEHDIEVKISKSIKWLEKRFEIRVIILGSADNTAPQEEIYKKFEKTFKNLGRIVQKRMKNGDLKFQIIPPKREDSEEVNDPMKIPEKDVTGKEQRGDEEPQAVEKSL